MTQHMTVALWCVMVAAFLPIVAALIAKSGKGYDNTDPRGWLAQQSGFRQRANAAQQNSYEIFPFFAAGVIIAHYLQAPQTQVNALALTFIGARILYIALYVGNQSTLRSLIWLVSFFSVIGLFVVAA